MQTMTKTAALARTLDLAVLRTLLAIEKDGSLARAAKTVGRSESAVSLQIKRLEDQVGQLLYRREGRGLVPTATGEVMLIYARRLIDLNNEALHAIGRPDVQGTVKLGVVPDYANTWLPIALAIFSRTHPSVRVEATAGRGPHLLSQLDNGELDLAVTFVGHDSDAASWSGAIPMAWIGLKGYIREPQEPVRLVVFDPPCSFRNAATTALDAANIAWSINVASPNLPSLWSAIVAGMGITVRTPLGLPPQLTTLGETAGLPRLPMVKLALFDRGAAASLSSVKLKQLMIETLQGSLDAAI